MLHFENKGGMRIVFLADAVSTQSAGIHYYGKQLINNITSSYPSYKYFVVSTKALNFSNTEDVVVSNDGDSTLKLRLRQIIKLPQVVNKLKPNIVIELAHFGPFRLDHGIQRVTVVHDLTPITHPQFHGLASNLSHRMLLRRILNKASHIICNSITTGEAVVSTYPETDGKIHTVYPGLERITLEQAVRENYFLSIGTIEPRKNYTKLLSAFDNYREAGGTANLKIIGSRGWGIKEFETGLNAMKHRSEVDVYHDITREELFNLLSKAKGYVSCSHYEGFGLPVLEAMSQGIPLVLSDIEVYREIANDVALFFDKENEEQFCNQLLTIEKDLDNYAQKSLEKYKAFEAMKLELPFLEQPS